MNTLPDSDCKSSQRSGGSVLKNKSELKIATHYTALCESQTIGRGTRVHAFAHILKGAVIGRDCNICDHVFIEGGACIGDHVNIKNNVLIWDGVTIEDDCFIGPGVIFINDRYPRTRGTEAAGQRYANRENWLVATTIRRGAVLGAGSIVLPGVSIGQYACIAAGSVVTRDVSDFRLVKGNPARPAGWTCTCGRPLNPKLNCPACGGRYEQIEDRLRIVE